MLPPWLPDFTSLHRDKLLAKGCKQKNPIRPAELRGGSGFVLLPLLTKDAAGIKEMKYN
jgi:hypothetical protein